RRYLHGRKDEDVGRTCRPRGHARADDEFSGAVKRAKSLITIRATLWYQKGLGKGSISNINLNFAADIKHLNFEKRNRLHATVISRIQAIAGRQRRASQSAAVQ